MTSIPFASLRDPSARAENPSRGRFAAQNQRALDRTSTRVQDFPASEAKEKQKRLDTTRPSHGRGLARWRSSLRSSLTTASLREFSSYENDWRQSPLNHRQYLSTK